jgi:hypothetical protein
MRPFSYTNAFGATYHLHVLRQGKNRTAYVMRKRAAGALSTLPEGYEVRENVYGRVSVRRTRPRLFTEDEEQLLSGQLKRLRPFAYRLDIAGRTATVYASAMDRKCFAESLDAEFANGFADALTKTLAGKYSPELVALFRARRKDKNAILGGAGVLHRRQWLDAAGNLAAHGCHYEVSAAFGQGQFFRPDLR